MHFVKLLKYAEKSYEDKPSFLILMSDGREYISNGCKFVGNTAEVRKWLTEVYPCENELNELLNAPDVSLEDVTDARHMFRGCKTLTKVELNMPAVVEARTMFDGCTSLTSVKLNMPDVVNAFCMFYKCTSLTSVKLNMPDVEVAELMFCWCKSLTSVKLNMPKVTQTRSMFRGCKSLTKKSKVGTLMLNVRPTLCNLLNFLSTLRNHLKISRRS